MPFDLLIRAGTVVTTDGVYPLDVAIEAGRIIEIAPEIRRPSRETIDATGLHIFPGLIDVHVHFNEPGRTEWEGFATGSAALAAGGGTCFFEMPLNAHPPTLDGESFDLKRAAAEASSRTDFALWGGLTPANLDRLEELAERGVVGFKAFMSNSGIDDFGRADDLTLFRGMETAARLGLPVAVHAENEELTSRLTAEARAAGRTGIRDYLRSRPAIAEVDAIRRAIAFARETGCSLHIVHISTAAGVEEVLEARGHIEGHGQAQITAETCPHYLLLNEVDVERIGALAKCAPPIRAAAEVERMWTHLAHGGIDLVASDHSPAPESMKSSPDFFQVWGGVAGVQSILAALLSRDPPLPLPQVAKLTATTPAQRFGIANKGNIEVGFDADLALVDIGQRFELARAMLLDRHKLSPYVGRSFRGAVKRTIVCGQTVIADGTLIGDTRGKLLKPTRHEDSTAEAAYGA
jgi:allantoinase